MAKSKINPSESIGDIIKAIKTDHQDLKKFIGVMKDEDASLTEKRSALKNFSSLLKSHAASEEAALYERCLKVPDLKVATHEGFVEHEVASSLLEKLAREQKKPRWEAEVKVLAELVEHHIEEEEGDFLPAVKKAFSKAKKSEMADEFYVLRKRSQKDISAKNAGVLHA